MRKSDQATRAQNRTSRMVEVGGGWYFKTREMGLVGPFRDELEAFIQLEAFIRLAEAGLLPESGDFLASATPRAVSAG